MAGSLLYLVDQDNKPVNPKIRIAVEAAFRWSVREYRNMDEADLAAIAEAAALGYVQAAGRNSIAVALCLGRVDGPHSRMVPRTPGKDGVV